jgi:16S rRNA (cytidine1402-2'-O)-methyltransferase
MSVLYIVSTPIGNLGDITLRALETLRAVPLIVAEDTRHTRKLLAHNKIHTRLLSYNEHSPASRIGQILNALGEGDVALVTDAGTPAVSDPGRDLVLAAHEAGFSVSALPGPSAALTALVLSGMDTSSFLFLGFLPRRPAERREKLREASDLPYTLVLFEAPHRIRRTLDALHEVLGDRALSTARELTKLHEEVRRGTIASEIEYWATQEPRGEYTLVVAGSETKPAHAKHVAPMDRVAELVAQGQKATEAVRVVARELGSDRRELYAAWLHRPQE